MFGRKQILILFFLFLSLALLLGCANPPANYNLLTIKKRAAFSDILMGDIVYFRIYGNDNSSSYERAHKFCQNLKQMQVLGYKKKDIKKGIGVKGPEQIRLYVGNNLIITFSEKDLENYEYKNLEKFARKWVDNIGEILEYKAQTNAKNYNSNKEFHFQGFILQAYITNKASTNTNHYFAYSNYFKKDKTLRILNPKTGWSIVVKICGQYPLPKGIILAIDQKGAEAIQLTSIFAHKIIIEEVN